MLDNKRLKLYDNDDKLEVGNMIDKNNELLTVIVTCYNGQKYLPTFFDQLNRQTYKNLKLVIVNDGSTDESLKLIKEYCNAHSFAKYIDSQNFGVATAKGMGLALAEGEFVTFCDVDDLLHPKHFEVLMTTVLDSGADMGVCSFKRVKENKIKRLNFDRALPDKKLEVLDKISAMQTFFSQKKYDYVLWNKVFSLKTLKNSGARFIEGTRYGEESPFIYSFLKASDKVAFKKVKSYYYIQRESSLMHVGFNPTRLDIFRNIDLVYKDCLINYPTVSPYVNSMRAGYACGLLYFMKKGKHAGANDVKQTIDRLIEDCSKLKYCKKTSAFRRIFIPFVVPLAKIAFNKKLKNK